jgi:hypothetical protein
MAKLSFNEGGVHLFGGMSLLWQQLLSYSSQIRYREHVIIIVGSVTNGWQRDMRALD